MDERDSCALCVSSQGPPILAFSLIWGKSIGLTLLEIRLDVFHSSLFLLFSLWSQTEFHGEANGKGRGLRRLTDRSGKRGKKQTLWK